MAFKKVGTKLSEFGFNVVSSGLGTTLEFDNLDQLDALIESLTWLKEETIRQGLTPPHCLGMFHDNVPADVINAYMERFNR